MEIKMTTGCVCDSLTVDNVEEISISDADKLACVRAIAHCIESNPQNIELNSFLQFLCESCGEYERTDKPCEECGDYIETFTLKI